VVGGKLINERDVYVFTAKLRELSPSPSPPSTHEYILSQKAGGRHKSLQDVILSEHILARKSYGK